MSVTSVLIAIGVIIFAYLIGSISFSVVFSKLFTGNDVRNSGSGNAGTTNVLRTAGKLPADIGVLVMNVTSLAVLAGYIKTGMPLVEKCITVDGSAVKNPMNVIAPIGTSLSDIFEFTGGFKSEPGKVLYGGPMMGISVPSIDLPLLKNNNAILAFNKKDSVQTKSRPCIKCGKCINVCPFGVNPPALAIALENHDIDAMVKFGADVCMECGCCSYGCPANRQLVQNHRLIKAELRRARANNKNKEART